MVLNVLEGLLKSVGRVVMRERTISRLIHICRSGERIPDYRSCNTETGFSNRSCNKQKVTANKTLV